MSIPSPYLETAAWTIPDWLTVIGFPAVGIGLFLAWRQAKDIKDASEAAKSGAQAASRAADQARKAADAARESSGRTERRIADQNVLMLVSQVQRVADALDGARDADEVIRVISEWIGVASELQGILEAQSPDHELIGLLSPSIEVAAATKNEIIENKESGYMPTGALREQLLVIRVAASRIQGRMRAYSGAQPDA